MSNNENLIGKLLINDPMECDKELTFLPEVQRTALNQKQSRLASNEPPTLNKVPVEDLHRLRFVYSAADALEPLPPLEWVVENLIPACSVGMLVGAPGSKKTFSLLDLAVKASTGQDWLGFATRKSNVLILDEESGPNRIKRRLSGIIRAQSGDASLPLHFTSLAHFDLRNRTDLDQITNLIQTHHVNKNGGYRGSSAIMGAVDFLIKQISGNDSDTISFETEKLRDGEPVTFQARIHFGDEGTIWLSHQEGRLVVETNREKAPNCARSILALVETKGNLPDAEIIKALGERFQESTIISNLYSLRRSGKLTVIKQPNLDGATG